MSERLLEWALRRVECWNWRFLAALGITQGFGESGGMKGKYDVEELHR
jgi:hypothetical protein